MRIAEVWSVLVGVGLFLFLYWVSIRSPKIGVTSNQARFLLIGITGGMAGVACWHQQGQMAAAVTVLFFLALQMLVTAVDMETMEIPNQLVLALLLVGVISLITIPGMYLGERVVGAFVVSLPLLFITLLIPDAFGGGDIKLMAAGGFFLGWKLVLLALFIGVLTGGGYGIWLLVTRKKERKDHFAFGPFLSLGMTCSWFFGEGLLRWYLRLFWI